MAQITIDIPNQQAQRVLDALCADGGYNPESGQTQQQFAKQYIAQLIKGRVRTYENLKAQEDAIKNIVLPPDPDIT